MSTNRDFDRIASAWLTEGPSELADRVLDAALDEVHLTHQRRRLPVPWRTPTLNTPLRLAAGIAIIAVVGYAGLTFLNPRIGPGAGPSPTPTAAPVPTPTPVPTQSIVQLGTITLTDDGCTWEGTPGAIVAAIEPVIGRFLVVNETDTFANFGIYRLGEGHSWAEAADWADAANAELHGGPPNPYEQDFAFDVGNFDAPDRGQFPGTVTMTVTGTYGVVCSSNEPPPGLVFAMYLVGPLEVAIEP